MVTKFNLEKIFIQTDIGKMLHRLSDTLSIPFSISDVTQKIVFGSSPASDQKIPITFENSLIGHIHTSSSASPFLGEMIHYILRIEIEKNLLARETLNIYREISHLYDLSDKIATSMEIVDIAHQVIEKTQKLINCDQCAILLLNEKQKLDLVADSSSDPTLSISSIRRIIRRIIRTGNGEIIGDVCSDPQYLRRQGDTIASIICVPLKIKGKAIGVIVISSRVSRDYPADQLKLLTMMASQIAISIENARLYNQLRKAFIDTVYTLADTIEKRDPYTGGHTRRVMEYSLAIGEDLQIPPTEMMNLRLASILHDIGKIGVKDHILRKGGNFTEEEFQEIKRHPLVGEEILKNIKELNHLIPGIKSHHERYDGNGYPEGLKGEEIPIIARIISVADAFDAMTSDRPYRKALTIRDAFMELRSMEGTQFDPKLIQSFLSSFKKKNLKKFLPKPDQPLIHLGKTKEEHV